MLPEPDSLRFLQGGNNSKSGALTLTEHRQNAPIDESTWMIALVRLGA